METLVFHLEADKLDIKVLDSIKAFFGNRKIAISVKPENALLERIERGRQSEIRYSVPHDVMAQLANALEADEPVDVVTEISRYEQIQP